MKKTAVLLVIATAIAYANISNADNAGKMYLKVDGGYTYGNNHNTAAISAISGQHHFTGGIADESQKSKAKGFNADIGLGYNISNSLRTDLELRFSGSLSSQKVLLYGARYNHSNNNQSVVTQTSQTNIQAVTLEADFKAISTDSSLLASAYYDLKTNSFITPFITLGVGIAYGNSYLYNNVMIALLQNGSYTKDDGNEILSPLDVKISKKLSFAYKVGGGVALKVSQNSYFDISYELFGCRGEKKLTLKPGPSDQNHPTITIQSQAKPTHNFKIGFRMMF